MVITGASKGIGLEAARVLVSRGYTVYGISRSEPAFSHALFVHFKGDVADAGLLGACLDSIVRDAAGRGVEIAALVNNAGYAQAGAIEDVPAELVRRQFETNVFGLLEASRRLIPLMKKQRGRGKIINISSVVGHFAGPYGGIYSATKHSVEAISAAMRMELRPFGISVVVVNPGLTDTGFHAAANEMLQRLAPSSPLYAEWYKGYMARHMGGTSPEVVARVIADIVASPSPAPRYVIGRKERMVLMLRKVLPEGTFYSMVEKRVNRRQAPP